MTISSGSPRLLKRGMLAFNTGQSYPEQPEVCLSCVHWLFWPGWRWQPAELERELSCRLGAEASPESVCCAMNCLVISSGIRLPRWHVHPAARNANEQTLLRLNEMFQKVIKADFWKLENKLSSSLCKKKVWIVNACTHRLSFPQSTVCVDQHAFKGLGRQLRGSSWQAVNLTPQAHPVAWQWKHGSLEKASRF